MTVAPRLSAVIVSYNEPPSEVQACVTCLRRGVPDAEVVLVDNGESADRLADLVGSLHDVQLVRGHGNVGYGCGNNLGVAAATGSHILVMNPDTRIVNADKERLRGLLSGMPFGIVAPLHQEEDGRSRYHIFPGRHWLREFAAIHVWAILKPRGWDGPGPVTSLIQPGSWITGSAFLVRRDEFIRLGGLDERFFIYYEDRELSDRYREAGLPLRCDPALTVTHAGGGAFPGQKAMVQRIAWGALGWLQYTHLRNGWLAARTARALLSVTYGGTGWLFAVLGRQTRSVNSRLARKGRELDDIRRAIRSPSLPAEACHCYPDARGGDG